MVVQCRFRNYLKSETFSSNPGIARRIIFVAAPSPALDRLSFFIFVAQSYDCGSVGFNPIDNRYDKPA